MSDSASNDNSQNCSDTSLLKLLMNLSTKQIDVFYIIVFTEH